SASPASALSGDPVQVSWRVRNQGVSMTNAPSWVDRILLSSDGTLDGSDTELARVTHSGALAQDGTYTAQQTVNLPQGVGGDFHVFVVTDFTGAVFEFSFEDNNTGRTLTPLSVTRKPDPDLVVLPFSGPANGQPGQALTVGWTVQNGGPGLAQGPWVD